MNGLLLLMNKKGISAFFPAYLDESTIELMVNRLQKVLKDLTNDYEIIIVDDCSPDKSGEIADKLAKKYKNIKVIHHKKNTGYGGALKSGFKAATKDLVFYTDGDAQYDVSELKKLMNYIDDYDFVTGVKIIRADRFYRVLVSKIYYQVIKLLFGIKIRDVVEALTNLYDAEIAELDYNVNIFLDNVDELGLKNNTIIVIMADSGEELYDHGYFKHSTTLYQEIIHVPLLIYYPGKLKPKSIEEPVSTIDIFPTIFDILEIGIPQEIDEVSLLPLIKNGSYGRQFVKSELFGLPGHETKKQTAIIHNEWKLIEVEPETESIPSGLYNLRTYPKEQKNLYEIFPEKGELLRKYIANR